ncbi:MAG: deoxyribose-phosphate aldolase [Aquificae bacterium]|nr:deoxyribose-phosphate aldolase [Aquificota bacterium]
MDLLSNINRYIDHSALKPYLTYDDIEQACKEAQKYKFYAVCVNPFFVRKAYQLLKDTDIKVCSVVGFPLGANTLKTKLVEATTACSEGAKELDIVWNISAFKSKDYTYVEEEIKTIICYTQGCVHKIIVETAYLTQEEKIKAVEIVINSGADYIKTSTGFAPKGATIEDIKLFKKLSKGKIKVKASGGIKDYKTALEMIQAGADRLGTSNSIKIMEEILNLNKK